MTAIDARDVRKAYGSLEVLRGVTVAVAPGERLVLLGRSGSGKSTFLRCLNGLERINGGQLTVLGIDLAAPRPDLRALRRQVGIVFQSFNLFPHLTVEANVTLAQRRVLRRSPAEAAEVAGRVLAQVGLASKLRAYRPSSPAASNSASPWHARWLFRPRSCCSTRSPPRSTPNWLERS